MTELQDYDVSLIGKDKNKFQNASLLAEKRGLPPTMEIPSQGSSRTTKIGASELKQRLGALKNRPVYVDFGPNDKNDPSPKVHWFYGDQAKKYEILGLINQTKGLPKHENINLNSSSKGWLFDKLAKIRKMVINGKHEDSIGTQLDNCGEAVERYENRVFWLKLIVVVGVIAYHIQENTSILGWSTSQCTAAISRRNFACFKQSQDCGGIFSDPTNYVYHCTEADYKAKNNKFCVTGYCTNASNVCHDYNLKKRIEVVAQKYKDCLFKNEKNKDNGCGISMDNGEENYADCRLGVEMFIFVFVFNDILLKKVLAAGSDMALKYPIGFIWLRIGTTIGAMLGWVMLLYVQGKKFKGGAILDLMYVFLFIGVNVLLDLFKITRAQYIAGGLAGHNDIVSECHADGTLTREQQKQADIRQESLLKFERTTVGYSMQARIMLIPIWAAILIVFIKEYGGNALNIVYFALTPFDSLMDGVFDRGFISQINGIMINTHKKMFKYRAAVSNLIKTGMWMNICMILVQTTLVFVIGQDMKGRMQNATFSKGNLPLRMFGEGIIITWFVGDIMVNLIQLACGTLLQKNCGLLTNDIMPELEVNAAKIANLQDCKKDCEQPLSKEDYCDGMIIEQLALKFQRLEPAIVSAHNMKDFWRVTDMDVRERMRIIYYSLQGKTYQKMLQPKNAKEHDKMEEDYDLWFAQNIEEPQSMGQSLNRSPYARY